MIRRRPAAVRSIIELAEYIRRDSEQAADRFIVATRGTFDHLERFPESGRRYESADPWLAGLRIWAVSGFRNHLVFYRPIDDGVEIINVLHGARDIGPALAADL